MKTYGVTYIDLAIDLTALQYDLWSIDTLLNEAGKDEVIILLIYDPDTNEEWVWEK